MKSLQFNAQKETKIEPYKAIYTYQTARFDKGKSLFNKLAQ